MSEDRKLENEIGEVRDTHRPGAECPNLGGFFRTDSRHWLSLRPAEQMVATLIRQYREQMPGPTLVTCA
jgi:hypothetical protein